MRSIGDEQTMCHMPLAVAYLVHGPSKELHTPGSKSEAGRIEGAQAFTGCIGDYCGLLSVLNAAHPRTAISSCRATANICLGRNCVAFPKQGETDATGNPSPGCCLIKFAQSLCNQEKLAKPSPNSDISASGTHLIPLVLPPTSSDETTAC
jgi:hypothetical protein